MIATIKSEFLKLLTIRSTYVMIGLSMVIAIIFAFFFEGYKGNTGSAASTLSPLAFQEIINNSAGIMATFVSIIAILFIGHEYRYNTILNTLTANARRTQVMFSKIFTVSIFSLVIGLAGVAFALGCYLLGLEFRNATLPAQNIDWLYNLGKLSGYFLGYGLIALLIGFFIRGVVGAIAFYFIVPSVVESLLSLVLKGNAKYLPFTSLDSIMGMSLSKDAFSPGKSIMLIAVYLVVGWFIAWVLFLRRDAN